MTAFPTFCVLVLLHSLTFVMSQEETMVTDEDSGIQEIIVPMCRNLVPYNLTRLPNAFRHRTQARVYRAIEHLWPYMDYSCSTNFRLFVCSLYLPKYDPDSGQTFGPCRNMCKRAKKGCGRLMRQANSRWPRQLRCNSLPTRDCTSAIAERRGPVEYPYCTMNSLPVCATLPYTHGYLPNPYHQHSITEVSTELQYYNSLVESRCSHDLPFFLCGTYMPFCVREQFQWFSVPCRELCEQVLADCTDEYETLYHGIPWPNKLQCHRYPLSTSGRPCAMPGDLNSQDSN